LKSFPKRFIAIGAGHRVGVAHRFVTLIALFGLAYATGSVAPNPAVAQSGTLGTRNVIIDLSVLGDGGKGLPPMARGITPAGPGRVLLMPKPTTQRSILHVAPSTRRASAPAARQSNPRPAPSASRQAAKPVASMPAKPSRPSAAPPPPKVLAPPVTASKPPPAPLAPRSASHSAPPPPPTAPTGGRRSAPPAPPAPQKDAALAALPPPSTAAPTSKQPLSVLFSGDSAKVGDKWHAQLAGLAKKLETNSKMRLQLLAYAGGASLSASRARRLSLSRALAVRSYLMKAGVRSTRIDVRALGDKVKNEPRHRVDVTVVGR
jgi:outer membrane protein OmpA-like peptidoglycan-associated protein